MTEPGGGMTEREDDFDAYKLMLLDRLGKLEKGQDELSDKFDRGAREITAEIATLKVKSGVWGFMAGAVPTTLAIVYAMVRGKW